MSTRVAIAVFVTAMLGACARPQRITRAPSRPASARRSIIVPDAGSIATNDAATDASPRAVALSFGDEEWSATFFSNGQRCGRWSAIAPDGTFRSSTALSRDCVDVDERLTGRGRWALTDSARSALCPASADASGVAPIGPRLHGSLTLPQFGERAVSVQWYSGEGECLHTAVVTDESPSRRAWRLILHREMLSPIGLVRAFALGDLDDDGRDDLAFVSEGLGTCGGEPTPSCPVFWVRIFATSASATMANRDDSVLLRNSDLDAARARLGEPSALRWRGSIERSRYEVTAVGARGRLVWTIGLQNGSVSVSAPREQ